MVFSSLLEQKPEIFFRGKKTQEKRPLKKRNYLLRHVVFPRLFAKGKNAQMKLTIIYDSFRLSNTVNINDSVRVYSKDLSASRKNC